MKSPPHQRSVITDYFLSQSDEGTVVHHVEKVASERIYGFKHDVWDVDSSDGRWWVITNPTNLYPQEMAPTSSVDHALALHIGVTARMLARKQLQAPVDGPPREFVARAGRKFEQAAEALNRADEPEDFQAVGMRLRECLISFAQETAAHALVPASSEPPKQGDFKHCAELLVQAAAPGSHVKEMRSYLRVVPRDVGSRRLAHPCDEREAVDCYPRPTRFDVLCRRKGSRRKDARPVGDPLSGAVG